MSFSLPNPLADIRSRTRKEDQLIEQIEQDTEHAKFHNSTKANTKPILGKIMRYCPLDENPLKAIKPKMLEDLNIPLPRYRCTLCKSVFQGFGLDLYHESKKSVKAICFESDSQK